MAKAPFRRPAALRTEDAENLPGDEDPAEYSEVAHTAAQMLLGVAPPEDMRRRPDLLSAIEAEGVDLVAELFAKSPADTLPGVLWRLYLIQQWMHRDEPRVQQVWQEGAAFATRKSEVPTRPLPDPCSVLGRIDQLLNGVFKADFAQLLSDTALVMEFLSVGLRSENWITDEHDELADRVTLRNSALIATARELLAAAEAGEFGHLE